MATNDQTDETYDGGVLDAGIKLDANVQRRPLTTKDPSPEFSQCLYRLQFKFQAISIAYTSSGLYLPGSNSPALRHL